MIIRVFSSRLKKEIIIIHSEKCWENANFCREIPANLNTIEQSSLDENNILHVPGKKSQALLEDGSICWLALRGTMDKLIGYDMI